MPTSGTSEVRVEPGSPGDPVRPAPAFQPWAGGDVDPYSRRLFESVPIGLALSRLNGEIVDVNPAFARITGRTVEETLRLTYWDITPERYRAEEQRARERLEQTGSYGPDEKEYVHKDGRLVPVRVHGLIFEHQGERFIWSSVEDISDLKQVEDQHLAHLQYLRAMDRVNRAIRVAPDLDQLMGDVLQELLSIFGCDRAWLVYPCDPDAPAFRILKEANVPKWPGALAVAVGDIPWNPDASALFTLANASEDPIRCDPATGVPIEPAARHFSVQSQMFLALHPKTGSAWIFGMHHCETAHIWTDEEARIFCEIGRRMSDALNGALYLRDLRESEERLRTIVEHAPEAIFVFDGDTGLFVQANLKAAALFKRTALALCELGLVDICEESQPDGRLAAEMVTEAIARVLAGASVIMEWGCRDAEGRQISCEAQMVRLPAGSRRLIRVSLTDLTERRQLEAQLRQAVKLQAIGTLAGGIAHDFNNMLVVILAGTAEMASVLGAAHPLADQVRDVAEAGQRAADLTRQLLAFGRRQVMQAQTTDLNEVVSKISRLLVRLIGEDVELRTQLAAERVMTVADQGQIGQVVVNLCTNARDAMPHGGSLRIVTGYRTFGIDDADRPSEAAPGRYATIDVADTGTGIPPAILGRIFEPFFTTKDVGKGTGLGLSTAYGIVKQSGGDIVVKTEVGRGTTFTVVLPARDEMVTDPEPGSRIERPSRPGPRTILIVEDDDGVAAVVSRVLRGEGYAILEARNGEAALELLRNLDIEQIDLLLTDVVMPRMSGTALANRLRERRPDLKVLCMSGYEVGGAEPGRFARLQKPFLPAELIERVRETLGRPAR
jgi:PAS domain S-box-containing protein